MRRLVSNKSINKTEICSKLPFMWSDGHSFILYAVHKYITITVN